eukprot:14245650-Alexandrium_andersonii.AAC.1
MPSMWMVTQCPLHWHPGAGVVADDVCAEVSEELPVVTPEEALAVGVSWDADEALSVRFAGARM